jgi:hypothetical protein
LLFGKKIENGALQLPGRDIVARRTYPDYRKAGHGYSETVESNKEQTKRMLLQEYRIVVVASPPSSSSFLLVGVCVFVLYIAYIGTHVNYMDLF